MDQELDIVHQLRVWMEAMDLAVDPLLDSNVLDLGSPASSGGEAKVGNQKGRSNTYSSEFCADHIGIISRTSHLLILV